MSEDTNQSDYFVIDQPAMLAIVGYCMTDLQFLRNCSKTLTKSHINHPIIADVYDFIIGYFKSNEAPPSIPEVESHLFSKYPDKTTYDKYRMVIHEAVTKKENFNKRGLSTKISGWLKTVTLKKGISQAAHLFNKNNYEQSEKEITQLIAKLRDSTFEDESRANIINIRDRLEKLKLQKGEACTLGNAELDDAVLEGAKLYGPEVIANDLKTQTTGCLLPGEITMVLGPSNSGKTTLLTTIAVSNIAIGKKVAYVSHEEGEDKMAIKFFQSFTEMTGEEMSFPESERFKNAEKSWIYTSSTNLFLYDWIKPGKMFCEDVISMLENENEREKLSTGRGFDLVIVDYPKKTKSRDFRGKDDWSEAEYVYEQYRLLARKHGFHCITPVQTNREGFRSNKEGSAMIDMDNAASGFGVMTLADIVLSINRSYNDVSMMVVKLFVAKSRQGANKKTFISETRYDLGRTHGVGYGCYVAPPIDASKIDDTYITHALSGTGRPKTIHIINALAEKKQGVVINEVVPTDKKTMTMQQVQQVQQTPAPTGKNINDIVIKLDPLTGKPII